MKEHPQSHAGSFSGKARTRLARGRTLFMLPYLGRGDQILALGVMLLSGGQSNPTAVPEQHWCGSVTKHKEETPLRAVGSPDQHGFRLDGHCSIKQKVTSSIPSQIPSQCSCLLNEPGPWLVYL